MSAVGPSLTRRSLLASAGASALLVGCGAQGSDPEQVPVTPGVSGSPSASPVGRDLSASERVVQFSNWPQYIDAASEGAPSTLEDFTSSSGIEVVYTDDINDSNEFFAKVRSNLEQGRIIDRDIVVLTEEGVELFIENGFAARLDKELIPNWVNLLPALRDVPFDPGREYSLPWQSGFTGIGWNSTLLERELGVSQITSLDQFFDPRLKGRITILAEMPDTMGLLLNWLGFDMTSFTDDQFGQTLDELVRRIDDGFIRQVTGNDYLAALDSGDAIASIGWSGDILALGRKFGFALPESGGMIWADNMVIPSVAVHQANAEALMNFYYDPMIAARLAAWVQYVCPVQGAQEAMASVDASLVDDPWIFPTPELLANVSEFMRLPSVQRLEYERRFLKAVLS